jgi:hypothetical protein
MSLHAQDLLPPMSIHEEHKEKPFLECGKIYTFYLYIITICKIKFGRRAEGQKVRKDRSYIDADNYPFQDTNLFFLKIFSNLKYSLTTYLKFENSH